MTRSREIYISPDVHQVLKWLVAASNTKQGPNDPAPKLTVDGLASDVLMQWIKATHPKLIELWQHRQALDEKAMELLK